MMDDRRGSKVITIEVVMNPRKKIMPDEEWRFCQAVEKYRVATGHRFLTNSEYYRIAKALLRREKKHENERSG